MQRQYLWIFELIWLLFVILICVLVLLPLRSILPTYPFTFINILFIAVFLLLCKHSFFIKYSFFAKWQKFKVGLFFLCIPLIFKLVEFINYFITYIDENAFDSFITNTSPARLKSLSTYIYNEMLLLGVASVVVTVFFAFRVLLSVWRWRNRQTI